MIIHPVGIKNKNCFRSNPWGKEINKLASEYKLQLNLIQNWKRKFLEKASTVFDTKRDKKAMEAVNGLQEENDELAKKSVAFLLRQQFTTVEQWFQFASYQKH